MGTPNETLNYLISKLLNKKRLDFLRILERIENPHFSPISNGEILGSIYWVKISTIFLHSIISLDIKEKGHSFLYSSYPCWFMSRKFSPNFEGSINLGFGVFSFYILNYEQFRAPKRWANQHRFYVWFFTMKLVAQRMIVKTHWVFLYSKVTQ